MTTYYLIAVMAILIGMVIGLSRAILGPTIFDRILAVNAFGTKAVLLIAVFAFISDRKDILDIALLYSLLNFIGVIAALRLVERGAYFAKDKKLPHTNEEKIHD